MFVFALPKLMWIDILRIGINAFTYLTALNLSRSPMQAFKRGGFV